ncbi:hypothetical protein VTN00DRAFT_652 [Thermoascus crustaceus]|uniref:uncharacterized protein n=1 Tax=Thermoascus crustaceus TaxID=5088 RepID=UPI00374402C5
MHILNRQALTALFIFLLSTASSHSWIEQLMVIAPNGTFVGAPGYARGNVLRTAPGFSDTKMVNLIPPTNRATNEILPTDTMCKDTQRKQIQTEGSPRLQAAPGAAVALRFQENGHVTLPQNQAGKPKNRGTVYVYGTTQPREDDTFLAIHNVWNRNGTGGDKRGILLSVQNFDDGRCYQINGGQISTQRQAKFPHQANQLMGADLWCQQDIALPSDVPPGKPYTLYWVWDWPTAPGVDPNLPKGKNEIYTTCMDVDIMDGPKVHSNVATGYVEDQPLDNAAIPSQFAELLKSRTAPEPAVNNSSSPMMTSPTATSESSYPKAAPISVDAGTISYLGCGQASGSYAKPDSRRGEVKLRLPFYKSPRLPPRSDRDKRFYHRG